MTKLTAIAAVAAAALVAVAGAPSSSSGSVQGSIVITGRISRFEDNGMAIATKTLLDKHGRTVGWANTVCFDLRNSSSECIGTFVLPRGKIMVAGTRHSQQYFVFAIVGGTGLYVSAGGTLIGNLISESPRTERLVFSLE